MNLLKLFCLQLLVTVCTLAYSSSSTPGDKQSKLVSDKKKMERFWRKNVLRPGKRSEGLSFPFTFSANPDLPDDFNELLRRETRANSNHMRYGRGNPNFFRYGRINNDYKENTANTMGNKFSRHNSLFLRYGRGGNNDFIRYSYLDDPEGLRSEPSLQQDLSEDYDNENREITTGVAVE
ncbi:hypothetical protein Trydic_g12750 [Trypoxylus dichotomus]